MNTPNIRYSVPKGGGTMFDRYLLTDTQAMDEIAHRHLLDRERRRRAQSARNRALITRLVRRIRELEAAR